MKRLAAGLLIILVGSSLEAQSPIGKKYFAASAGIGVDESADTRSSYGFLARGAYGEQVLPRLSIQAEAATSYYRASDYMAFTGPCPIVGCSAGSAPPPDGAASVSTFGVGAVFGEGRTSGGMLIVAGGLRHLRVSGMEGNSSSENHAYGELGVGVAIPVGVARAWLIEARYQTSSGSLHPHWIVPFTLGFRF